MHRTGRHFLLLAVVSVFVAGSVWLTAASQRSAAARGVEQVEEAQRLLTAMLDQETGLRGYLQTGRHEFLEPYEEGQREFAVAVAALRDEADDAAVAGALARTARHARSWQALARRRTEAVARDGVAPVPLAEAEARKRHMDLFRAAEGDLMLALDARLRHAQSRASAMAVGISLALSLLVGGVGAQLITRREREERRREARDEDFRATQAEFAEVMQVVHTEADAHDLVRRHLRRSLPDHEVVVLRRNNSENRLEPVAGVDHEALAERLRAATPSSCLATRTGKVHERTEAREPLLGCEVCGAADGASRCVPLHAGGEIIGSVLVRGTAALEGREDRRVAETVAQAAPVLANLRNLALAETRAATDALTGLPNRRALSDTLNRMVAEAGRTLRPLTAIAVDVDHFKHVNDAFGHDAGDVALAAVAAALKSTSRASDFAARFGGEEFVVLCPDTDTEGGAVLAEKLRAAVAALAVAGLTRPLTASFGVATLPAHAGESEGLLRQADRALYAAKAAGRNRVECAATAQAPPVPVD